MRHQFIGGPVRHRLDGELHRRMMAAAGTMRHRPNCDDVEVPAAFAARSAAATRAVIPLRCPGHWCRRSASSLHVHPLRTSPRVIPIPALLISVSIPPSRDFSALAVPCSVRGVIRHVDFDDMQVEVVLCGFGGEHIDLGSQQLAAHRRDDRRTQSGVIEPTPPKPLEAPVVGSFRPLTATLRHCGVKQAGRQRSAPPRLQSSRTLGYRSWAWE